MPERLTSLRVWLLAGMAATAAAVVAIASSFDAPGSVVAIVVAVLLIGEAWLAATMFYRTVRRPIARAIETVDRLATGDFSARMGISGPAEFAHLSQAVDGVAGRLQQADTEQTRFLADLAHEVVARVRAQLRRARGFEDDTATLRVGTVELDRRARRCTVGGDGVDLTRREFDLLETLLGSPGRAYTRDQLLDEVWGSRFVSEKTIDVHIVSLRRKFGDSLRISTLRGVGYRLEPDA